jgi:CRISPR-associated endonuclease/helicase Cas3
MAPFGCALLTATPQRKEGNESEEAPFALTADDEAHPILSRRLTAPKPARLEHISGKEDGDAEPRRVEAIVSQAQGVLQKLKASGATCPAIGVVVNRVARARAVFERLETQLKDVADIMLLIGPARAVDRDDLARRLEPIRTRHPDAARLLSKPLIVVATQTIEAGVDIDFDGLVTEAAALDALRQRFGRLNRAGRDITPEAAILAHKEDIGTRADHPVYGDRIRLTWEKLQQIAAGADGIVDFGIEALSKQIAPDEAGGLAAPTSDAPILMPAYADLWSHTSPIPSADPDVALFLHGPDRSPASVQIVWRADFDEARDLRPVMGDNGRDARARLVELLKLVPPRAAEAIEVPLWAARAWLDQKGSEAADISDAVERATDTDEQAGSRHRAAFRWAGEDSDRTGAIVSRELRNGDLIVVPADYGGCDGWGWNPKPADSAASAGEVADVADAALWPYRGRRFAVRVTPDLVAQSCHWPTGRRRWGSASSRPCSTTFR